MNLLRPTNSKLNPGYANRTEGVLKEIYDIFGIATKGAKGDKLRDMEGNLVNPSDLLWDEVIRISQYPGLLRMGSVHHG